MRVSSPIGDLPFTPLKLRYHDRALQVDGVMGAWPAQVQIGVADLPAVLRLVPIPLAVLAATTTVGLLARALVRRHH